MLKKRIILILLLISLITNVSVFATDVDTDGNTTVSEPIIIVQKGWQTILANNTVNETTPDFSKVATTNEGLFKADDDYTATTGMKSYYFRGAVDNNWVKFGKEGNKDIRKDSSCSKSNSSTHHASHDHIGF